MGPGWKGILRTNTPNLRSELVPQELLAVTEIHPPLAPVVVVIEVLVDEPVHPEGKLHVYDVAPDMGEIL